MGHSHGDTRVVRAQAPGGYDVPSLKAEATDRDLASYLKAFKAGIKAFDYFNKRRLAGSIQQVIRARELNLDKLNDLIFDSNVPRTFSQPESGGLARRRNQIAEELTVTVSMDATGYETPGTPSASDVNSHIAALSSFDSSYLFNVHDLHRSLMSSSSVTPLATVPGHDIMVENEATFVDPSSAIQTGVFQTLGESSNLETQSEDQLLDMGDWENTASAGETHSHDGWFKQPEFYGQLEPPTSQSLDLQFGQQLQHPPTIHQPETPVVPQHQVNSTNPFLSMQYQPYWQGQQTRTPTWQTPLEPFQRPQLSTIEVANVSQRIANNPFYGNLAWDVEDTRNMPPGSSRAAGATLTRDLQDASSLVDETLLQHDSSVTASPLVRSAIMSTSHHQETQLGRSVAAKAPTRNMNTGNRIAKAHFLRQPIAPTAFSSFPESINSGLISQEQSFRSPSARDDSIPKLASSLGGSRAELDKLVTHAPAGGQMAQPALRTTQLALERQNKDSYSEQAQITGHASLPASDPGAWDQPTADPGFSSNFARRAQEFPTGAAAPVEATLEAQAAGAYRSTGSNVVFNPESEGNYFSAFGSEYFPGDENLFDLPASSLEAPFDFGSPDLTDPRTAQFDTLGFADAPSASDHNEATTSEASEASQIQKPEGAFGIRTSAEGAEHAVGELASADDVAVADVSLAPRHGLSAGVAGSMPQVRESEQLRRAWSEQADQLPPCGDDSDRVGANIASHSRRPDQAQINSAQSLLQPMVHHNCIVYDSRYRTQGRTFDQPVEVLHQDLVGLSAEVEFEDDSRTKLQCPVRQVPEHLRFMPSITRFSNGQEFHNLPRGAHEFAETGTVTPDAPIGMSAGQLLAYRARCETARSADLARTTGETTARGSVGAAGDLRLMPELPGVQESDIRHVFQLNNLLESSGADQTSLDTMPADITDVSARKKLSLPTMVRLMCQPGVLKRIPDGQASGADGRRRTHPPWEAKVLVLLALELRRAVKRPDEEIYRTLRRVVPDFIRTVDVPSMRGKRNWLLHNDAGIDLMWIIRTLVAQDGRAQKLLDMLVVSDPRLFHTLRDDEIDTLGLLLTLRELLGLAEEGVQEQQRVGSKRSASNDLAPEAKRARR